VAKTTDTCFLCEQPGKCKKYTFYSGVMKGGTTHRMINYTVTFFERWSELTIHEIQVCRECPLRLWKQKQKPLMILYGAVAGVMAPIALLALILLPGIALRVAVGGLAAVAVLVLGGLFLVQLQRYNLKKPKQSQFEPLVIAEASTYFPDEKRTFLTCEQYIERSEAGVFG